MILSDQSYWRSRILPSTYPTVDKAHADALRVYPYTRYLEGELHHVTVSPGDAHFDDIQEARRQLLQDARRENILTDRHESGSDLQQVPGLAGVLGGAITAIVGAANDLTTLATLGAIGGALSLGCWVWGSLREKKATQELADLREGRKHLRAQMDVWEQGHVDETGELFQGKPWKKP